MYSRSAQIFLEFPPQTPRWSLGQILPGHQFSANLEVVWPRHGGSEGPQVGLILTAHRTFGASVTWSNDFRIGWKLVSRQDLAQTSPWSMRRKSQKSLGWPTVHLQRGFWLIWVFLISYYLYISKKPQGKNNSDIAEKNWSMRSLEVNKLKIEINWKAIY